MDISMKYCGVLSTTFITKLHNLLESVIKQESDEIVKLFSPWLAFVAFPGIRVEIVTRLDNVKLPIIFRLTMIAHWHNVFYWINEPRLSRAGKKKLKL